MKRALAGVLIVAASCGGSGGAKTASHDYPTPDAVISALGSAGLVCTSPTPESPIGVQAATDCTLDGESVTAVHFGTDAERSSYSALLNVPGGHGVLGSTWAVTTETQATAAKIAAAIGGTAN